MLNRDDRGSNHYLNKMIREHGLPFIFNWSTYFVTAPNWPFIDSFDVARLEGTWAGERVSYKSLKK